MEARPTYPQRYLSGEHERVWAELVALGGRVREEPLYSDAWAVACETMRRVRHNIETLIPRLQELDYVFGAGFFDDLSPAEAAEALRQAPIFAPPSSAAPTQVAELEGLVGPLPVSVRAY